MAFVATESISQQYDPQIYIDRDSLISSHMSAEEYHLALPLIEKQLLYIRLVELQDSLYRYVYRMGRSAWKVQGAEEGLARAEALVEEVMQTDTNRIHQLQAYEDLSWVYYETGRNDKCLQADLTYLDIASRTPHASPRIKSIAFYSVGFDYMQLGKWNDAAYYFAKAAEPLLAHGVNEPERLVNTYNALGASQQRMGDFAAARESFDKSLASILLMPNEVDRLINRSNVKGNLSLIYELEGDIVNAKAYLHEAIASRKEWLQHDHEPWKKDQQKKLLASNYHNLGAMYFKLGDYSRAKQILELERSFKKRIYEPGHPEISKTLETFGSLQVALEQYDSALVNLELYRTDCLANFGKESYFTATAYQRLAKVYLLTKRYDEALKHYNEAIAIYASIGDDTRGQELAECHLFRAEVFAALDDYERAIGDADVAIEIYRSTRKSVDVSLGQAYLTKAGLLSKFGDDLAALAVLDSALSNFKQSHGAMASQSKLNYAAFAPYSPAAYYLRAEIFERVNPGKEGRGAAMMELEKAKQILRSNKRAFDADEAQLYLYEDHVRIFEKAIGLHYAEWLEQGDPDELNRIFTLAEESRTILLRRQLAGFSSLRMAEVPDSILVEERRLMSVLTGVESVDVDNEDEFFTTESAYEDLQAHIAENYPNYYRLRYDEEVSDARALQSGWIASGSTVIRYIVSGPQVYAICLGKEKEEIVALEIDSLAQKIQQLNLAIVQNNDKRIVLHSERLYAALFAPLLPHFDGNELYIIPDKELFGLNFEALVNPASGRYVIENYTVSYLHSATTAMQFKELSTSSTRQSIVGHALAFAPGFSDQVKELYLAAVTDSALIDPGYLLRIQQPFAVSTAQQVSALFAGQAYTGAEATEERFKVEADRFRIIHLGTHTEINNLSPLLSRLVLTKDAKGQEDGYLHAFEIYNLPLRAELAVLTACETGTGKAIGSEGVLSLAHSFAYAGVPSVVMSLWQIDEKTSAEIIENFYRELSRGLPKNEALRNAKLQYLAANPGELAAPYYWSGLVLIGDVAPIQVDTYGSWWYYMIAVVLLALVAVMAYRRRHRAAINFEE